MPDSTIQQQPEQAINGEHETNGRGRHAAGAGQAGALDPRQQTREFLGHILPPGAGWCSELRLFGVSVGKTGFIEPDGRYGKQFANYYEDADALVADLSRIRKTSCYVTLNPLRRDLLARTEGLQKCPHLACDEDVTRIRFVYVDIDPERPADISSTNDELAAALAVRDRIIAELGLEDSAIWGCSGNGAWILIYVDLPNDEASRKLVGRFLEALAERFGKGGRDPVVIDTTTRNPSRVMCLAGTIKHKGRHTPERPHREVTMVPRDGRPLAVYPVAERLASIEPDPKPKAATKPTKTLPKGEGGDRGRAVAAFVAKAVDEECGNVKGTAPGGRNNQLNKSAIALGTLVGAKVLDRSEAEARLRAAAQQCGLRDTEITATLASGLEKGIGDPRPLDQVGIQPKRVKIDLGRGESVAPAEDGTLDLAGRKVELEPFNLTDSGNAERMVHHFGEDFRYVTPWKTFVVWDGRHWALDARARVQRFAKLTARLVMADQIFGASREVSDWSQQSESAPRRDAMIRLAACEPDIPVLPSDLDTHPMLLCVSNGVVDLKTGDLQPHRRQHYITQLAPVAYDRHAKRDLWLKTIGDVFEQKEKLISFFKRYCGYCLTGLTTEQVLAILYGTGSNGKTTILNALMEVLGGAYALKAPADFLMVRRQPAHPTERADLYRKRLVVAIESGEGQRIDEVLIKELTGSDVIRARRMREDFWEFTPTHKLMLATNHRPTIRGTDHAIWRRIRLIPFNAKFEGAKKDARLPDKLREEYPGILAWCVEGALEWLRDGLGEPEEVTEATAAYKSDQDSLAPFLAERCSVIADARAKASDLYDEYKRWAETSREYCLSYRLFVPALVERGFEKYTSNGTWIRGVGIPQVSREDDPPF